MPNSTSAELQPLSVQKTVTNGFVKTILTRTYDHNLHNSTIAELQPFSIQKTVTNAFVKTIITRSYNHNFYNEVYRADSRLTNFEKRSLDTFLTRLEPSKAKILDIGCGSGKPFDEYIVANNCRLTGVDCSKKQICLARKNVPKGKYVVSDILDYNFNEQFDGVVMLYSLFHIPRDFHWNVLKKIYGALSNKGVVLLNIRKEDSGSFKFKKNFCGYPMYWSHFGHESFYKLLKNTGYKITVLGDEKDYGSTESHLWLLLEK